LNDAPDQQWRNFVCVETARITRPLEPSVELAVEICLA
jgi:D-hexose-6-phosphate mutarotase